MRNATAFTACLGAIVSLSAAALLPATAVPADVYRSVDAQGHALYSDTPSPGAQLINGRGARNAPAPTPRSASAVTPTAGSAGKPKPATPQVAQQQAAEQKTETAARDAVQQDLAETRAEQCKKAQDAYQQAIVARRIYKTNENGEREYLPDSEADQLRVNARLEMNSVCNSAQ